MRRHEIESFSRQSLTEELAGKYGDGRLRKEIRNYEIFRGSSVEHTQTDIWEDNNLVHITDQRHRSLWQKMVRGILKSANLTDRTGQILTDTIIRGDQLTMFSDYCLKHKNEIAQLYGLVIRRDIHNKSVTQLWAFLDLMGVRYRKLKAVKENAKKDLSLLDTRGINGRSRRYFGQTFRSGYTGRLASQTRKSKTESIIQQEESDENS